MTSESNKTNFSVLSNHSIQTFLVFIAIFLLLGCNNQNQQQQRGEDIPPFQVRPGYRVELAVDTIDNARFMLFDEKGVLYVSRPQKGDILSLRDNDGDGHFEERETFVKDYKTAHGLDYKNGWIWFSQTGAIHKARDTTGSGEADQIITVLSEDTLFSEGGGHWWRSLLVTDQWIYTSVGDPGNITPDTTTRRKKIWRFSRPDHQRELIATGIRNTEKLRLRPGTNELWGADHNSDWFGRPLGEDPDQQPITDENPPGEFNHYKKGEFYGHPFLVGRDVPRIEYQDRDDIIDLASRSIVPEWLFGPHWAPNGFAFLSLENRHFPADHRGDAFVGFHGSWNSSVRVGYRVQRILFDDHTGDPYGSLRIVGTLGEENEVLARPVDVVEAPDGSLLFSDDYEGRIYRIFHVGN